MKISGGLFISGEVAFIPKNGVISEVISFTTAVDISVEVSVTSVVGAELTSVNDKDSGKNA